jgi:acyl carrier protein
MPESPLATAIKAADNCEGKLRMDTTTTLGEVRTLVAETLGIMDRIDSLDASTRLVGSLPELDSLGVAQLVAEIEGTFGVEIDFSDVTIDIFETLGTLAAFVDANRP